MNKNCDGCLKAIDGICFPTGDESYEISGVGCDHKLVAPYVTVAINAEEEEEEVEA